MLILCCEMRSKWMERVGNLSRTLLQRIPYMLQRIPLLYCCSYFFCCFCCFHLLFCWSGNVAACVYAKRWVATIRTIVLHEHRTRFCNLVQTVAVAPSVGWVVRQNGGTTAKVSVVVPTTTTGIMLCEGRTNGRTNEEKNNRRRRADEICLYYLFNGFCVKLMCGCAAWQSTDGEAAKNTD